MRKDVPYQILMTIDKEKKVLWKYKGISLIKNNDKYVDRFKTLRDLDD